MASGFTSFATGLAKGLTNQINRRQDNKDKMDQIGLQYRLKALADKKEESLLQSKKEEQWAKSAQFLATQHKNPGLAKVSLEYLRQGYGVDDITKMVEDGTLRPGKAKEMTVETPNTEIKPVAKPTLEMPAGVDPNQVPVVAVPEGFEGPDIVPGPKGMQETLAKTDPKAIEVAQNDKAAQNQSVVDSMASNKPVQGDTGELDKYDGMVKEIAPELLEEPKKDLKPAEEIASGTDWEYVPPTKQNKIGTMAQEYANLQQAQQINDKQAIAKAEDNIEILKRIKNEDARLKAEAEGKNVFNYVILDENNTQVETITATEDADGNLINPAGPDKGKVIRLPNNYRPKRIDDEDRKRMWETTAQFNKDSKDYKLGAEATAESITLTRKMVDLLDDPDNKGMLSNSTAGLSMLNDTFNEVKSIQTFIENQKAKVEKSLESGDPDAQSYNIAVLERTIVNQAKSADEIIGSSPLSDKNQKLVLNKALYDNYRTLLAYKYAQANGQYGKSLSQEELRSFKEIAGNVQINEKAKGILLEQLKMQIANNKRRLDNLNTSIDEKTPLLGFRLSARGKRLENMINDPRDREFFKFADKYEDQSRVETTDKFKAANVEFEQQQKQKEFLQKADEFGLVPGKVYKTANGSFRKYLGGGRDPKNFIELKD